MKLRKVNKDLDSNRGNRIIKCQRKGCRVMVIVRIMLVVMNQDNVNQFKEVKIYNIRHKLK